MKKQASISRLIREVTHDPAKALTLRHPAVEQLARGDAQTVRRVLRAMREPTPAGQHPRDVVEALGAVLHVMAKRNSAPLVEVLEKNDAPVDPELIVLVGALGNGQKTQVVEPLIRALQHKSAYVRWSAALALVQIRTKRAIEPLAAALRDRSPMVQGTVVQAMRDSKFYGSTDAIEPLRRIVQNRRIKKHYPGLWCNAKSVLADLAKIMSARRT